MPGGAAHRARLREYSGQRVYVEQRERRVAFGVYRTIRQRAVARPGRSIRRKGAEFLELLTRRDRSIQGKIGRLAIIICPPTSRRYAMDVVGFERWAAAFEKSVSGAVERPMIVARLFGQRAARMEGSPSAFARSVYELSFLASDAALIPTYRLTVLEPVHIVVDRTEPFRFEPAP